MSCMRKHLLKSLYWRFTAIFHIRVEVCAWHKIVMSRVFTLCNIIRRAWGNIFSNCSTNDSQPLNITHLSHDHSQILKNVSAICWINPTWLGHTFFFKTMFEVSDVSCPVDFCTFRLTKRYYSGPGVKLTSNGYVIYIFYDLSHSV